MWAGLLSALAFAQEEDDIAPPAVEVRKEAPAPGPLETGPSIAPKLTTAPATPPPAVKKPKVVVAPEENHAGDTRLQGKAQVPTSTTQPNVLIGPQMSQDAINARKAQERARFIEESPIIQDVEIIKGNPFIEVFISGNNETSCFDVHEYAVEKTDKVTKIVPRFRRSWAEKPCDGKMHYFREKAADLDPISPASYEVQVLGYHGWHSRSLKP